MIGEDGQERHPRAHFGPILLGHYARDLRDVSEIVHHPCCQELPQRHRTEARVVAPQAELRVCEIPGPEDPQILGALCGELVEQGIECPFGVSGPVTEAVVRLEATVLALREDNPGAGHPVGFFTVNQMANVVEWTERVRTFRAPGPFRTDVPQERA